MKQRPMIRGRPSHAMAAALLEGAGLPTEDLRDAPLEHFFYAGAEEAPEGLIGLEIYGREALLRSLVVQVEERAQGLGTSLVRRAEEHAALQGVHSIYLLTLSAETFFAHLDYVRIERSAAPSSIKATREFASLCPASAALMVKQLI